MKTDRRKKLTEADVRRLRQLPKMTQAGYEAEAGKLGVHWTAIQKAQSGKTWAHI